MNKICLGYFQHNSKFLKWLLFFFQYPHRKVLLFPIQIHLLLKLTALLQKDCAEDNLTDLFTSMWSNLPHNYLTLPDRCQNLFFHYCYWSHWANLLCVSIQNEPNTLSNIFTHVIFFLFFFFISYLCCSIHVQTLDEQCIHMAIRWISGRALWAKWHPRCLKGVQNISFGNTASQYRETWFQGRKDEE